ncbi:cell division protein FtsL [Roseococcus pinisoli]|uniref:Uncharacterized protein n=1 Tax=Roseococcus pinisoli TaxID=2835040 RepID=A0ABS5QKF2_9PROT|nr:hypothetical protein [Roseococcus pinisoli]MBS7813547.1 hypothetical protein [Roseococcus pinisoli]
MIHPLTIVTFAAFLGAGLYVFQTKEEVAKLDRELRDVTRQIEGERSRTQTLSAEWARLNDQDRLRSMVASHLRDMQPMEPSQFQRFDDAQRRMPQIAAFVPEPTGFRRRSDAPSAPGEVLVFTAASMLAEAEPRRATPVRAVAAAPVVAAPVVAAATPPPAPAAAPAPVAAAPAPAPVVAAAPVVHAPAPVAAPAPRALAAARSEAAALPPIAGPASAPSRPAAAEVAVAAPRPALPPIAARVADAAPAPRPVTRARAEAARPPQLAQAPVAAAPAPLRTAMHVQPAPAPAAGSLLGGGLSLPPPVPFAR